MKLIINLSPTGMIPTKEMTPRELRKLLKLEAGNGRYGRVYKKTDTP